MMDVEMTDSTASPTTYQVHPLTLVSMADQYTRVTSGGAPLPKDAPVVGLLFGKQQQHGSNYVALTDAEDIPVHDVHVQTRQVGLHQTVYPQHVVVGWYRVVAARDSATPVPQDVQTTANLQQQYQQNMVFGLLQVPQQQAKDSNKKNDADDDDLPLLLYTLRDDVFVNVPWTLNTASPERVAVEHVMRQKQLEQKERPSWQAQQDLQISLQALQERVSVLQSYLRAVQAGTMPWDADLLRQVRTTMLHLHSVGMLRMLPSTRLHDASGTATSSSSSVLSTLALLTKTLDRLSVYTEKMQAVYESDQHQQQTMERASGTGGGGRLQRHASGGNKAHAILPGPGGTGGGGGGSGTGPRRL